jgi:hypothetical protein
MGDEGREWIGEDHVLILYVDYGDHVRSESDGRDSQGYNTRLRVGEVTNNKAIHFSSHSKLKL